MPINHYQQGDTLTFSGLFRDTANNLTDTAKPVFIILNPVGVSAVYTYGVDANVVRDATGSFRATAYIPTGSASAHGTWTYYILSTSGIQQAQAGRFIVDASPLWTGS